MNTHNKLTVLRMLLVPFFMASLLITSLPHRFLIAAVIFGIASLTDHYDGKLARKNGMITDFGKFLDPLADKVLVLSALVCFVQLGLTGSVVVMIIITREFMVTSVRLVAVESGKVIAANNWGKAKTVSQIVAILVVLVLQYLKELVEMNLIPQSFVASFVPVDGLFTAFYVIGEIGLWISVVFTVISGVIYIWDNRDFIKQAK